MVQKCYSLRQFWYRSAIVWDSSGTEVLQFGIVLVKETLYFGIILVQLCYSSGRWSSARVWDSFGTVVVDGVVLEFGQVVL